MTGWAVITPDGRLVYESVRLLRHWAIAARPGAKDILWEIDQKNGYRCKRVRIHVSKKP